MKIKEYSEEEVWNPNTRSSFFLIERILIVNITMKYGTLMKGSTCITNDTYKNKNRNNTHYK